MTDGILSEQIRYYRQRATEYDATAYGDVAAAADEAERIVEQMNPSGAVLEIACGTGVWTTALAAHAAKLVAIDAAPETVEIARARVPDAGVTFEVADIFTWKAPQRFDVIFFSAWLSHVPANRFEQFWASLRPMLSVRGRVLFLDEHCDERGKESYIGSGSEIVDRVLRDGSRFRVEKNFIDPDRLTARLDALGWRCSIEREGPRWVRGEAQPKVGT